MTSEFAIAVHALVYLNHKNTVLSSEELADNICTNPARVRKILAKLKKMDLVGTREGIKGGYHMEADASEVSLKDVCDALGMEVVKASWRSGSVDMECLVASGMGDIIDGIYGELNNKCKDYLNGITIQDVDRKIFGSATVGAPSP